MTTAQEKKHLFYLDISRTISTHAKCLRGNFGAVVVKDDIIIGTGFNGPARGVSHCISCLREKAESGVGYGNCLAVHAEINAIINAGGRRECVGATLYLDSYNRTLEDDYRNKFKTLACPSCVRTMINAGIEWLVYRIGNEPAVKHLPTMTKAGAIQ